MEDKTEEMVNAMPWSSSDPAVPTHEGAYPGAWVPEL